MDDVIEQKKRMRRRSATRRDRIARSAIDELTGTFQLVPLPKDNLVISGYHPIGSELDPRPLLVKLRRAGHSIALPVVLEKHAPLLFREWSEGDQMSLGPFGVKEPLPGSPEAMPNVLLVPLLAFDRRGYRLGYGGGFYDRTLTLLRKQGTPLAVGVGFAAQEVDAVPVAEYDQPLNWIVTEREVIDIGA